MSDADVSEYLRTYSQPGAMRAGFNIYRAVHQDKIDNEQALARNGKLKMPVLTLSGDGGRARGLKICLESAKRVAENVRGVGLADCGHWMAEEKPAELLRHLLDFFTNTGN